MTLTQDETATRKSPAERKYRVIQWGVGNVGTIGLRHFANNPAFELVGVLCNRPEKVGKNAGELAGFHRAECSRPTTKRPSRHLMPTACSTRRCGLIPMRFAVCCAGARTSSPRVARGGIEPNTATRISTRSRRRALRAAHRSTQAASTPVSRETSRPDAARIVSRIESIHIYEVVNFGKDTLKYLIEMGMGNTPDGFEPAQISWGTHGRCSHSRWR